MAISEMLVLTGLGVLPARWCGSYRIPYAIGARIELDSSGRRCPGFRRLVARLSPRRGAAFHRRQGRRDVEQEERVQGATGRGQELGSSARPAGL